MSHTTRRLVPLAMVFLTVGLSTAIVGPFLSLFLSTEVHAGPVRITVFLVLAPLASVLVSTLIARLSDRRPIRRLLLIVAALAGFAGSALTAVVRDYWVLLGLTVTATALAGAMFPQVFAYAREVLQGSERAAMTISTLRTLFSIAWVAGPPISAFLLDAGGFVWVYGAAALMYAVAAVVAYCWLDQTGVAALLPGEEAAVRDEPPPDATRMVLWLTAAGFALLQCAGNLGVQALSLFIGQELNGTVRDAGLILGLCAGLEIPLMLGFGALSTRVPLRRLILIGAGFGVAYYGLAAASTSVWQLAVGQLFNACLIAAVAGLGVTYMQDMLPGQPGRAATLFSNGFLIGSILAGPVLGAAQHFGFRMAYATGALLCVIGLILLLVARPAAVRAGRDRLVAR